MYQEQQQLGTSRTGPLTYTLVSRITVVCLGKQVSEEGDIRVQEVN